MTPASPAAPIVGIVGAGLIGRSWANVFARAGWQVRVWDPNADQREAAHALIAQSLHDLQAHGLVQDAAASAARVQIVAKLEEAVKAADYVQECGPEVLEIKRTTFAALDAAAPVHCVLASSTSAIVASQFTEVWPGARAASSRTRSTRRTWCRWSSCAGHRGRQMPPRPARAK